MKPFCLVCSRSAGSRVNSDGLGREERVEQRIRQGKGIGEALGERAELTLWHTCQRRLVTMK